MTLAGFEPAIPASEGPQTDALDRAATGISFIKPITLNSSPSSEAVTLDCVSNNSDLNLILLAVKGFFSSPVTDKRYISWHGERSGNV
jgi:hypothetical protein